MTAALVQPQDPFRSPERVAWIELTCLNCGELAGYIENKRVIRQVRPGCVRLDRTRLSCGRCGGLLLLGERGVGSLMGGV